MAKIVEHINYLENDRLLLERELAEIRNAKLFDKPTAPIIQRRADPEPSDAMNWPEYYYNAFQDNELLGKVLRATGWDRKRIFDIANKWAAENNKPLIPLESPKD